MLLFTLSAHAGDIVRDYPVQRVTDSVYMIEGPKGYPSVENQGFMNNPAFVVTGQGVILIDPGSSVQAGRMVLKQIRGVTDLPVTHVFNTHVHGDHWLGNQAIRDLFPEAVLIGHPEMIREANAGTGERWVASMARNTEGFTQGTVAVVPETPAVDAQTLTLNGRVFRIYAPGKAHSGNDIMIELVDESVVFTGDNVLNQRIARMDDATFAGNINACQVAIDIGAKHYIPGHGPVGDAAMVANFRNYLETLYTQVARLYEEGLEAFEMKEQVMAALAPYNDWVNFHDEVGRHVSLAVLEVERNAF